MIDANASSIDIASIIFAFSMVVMAPVATLLSLALAWRRGWRQPLPAQSFLDVIGGR